MRSSHRLETNYTHLRPLKLKINLISCLQPPPVPGAAHKCSSYVMNPFYPEITLGRDAFFKVSSGSISSSPTSSHNIRLH